MRKALIALAAASASLAVPMSPALADSYRNDYRGERHYNDHDRRQVYNSRARYDQPRRVSRDDRVRRGRDGRYYCERENGTTGLIIGAAGGALLGREIDGGRERTLGTVLGGAVGALLGREIDRSDDKCR